MTDLAMVELERVVVAARDLMTQAAMPFDASTTLVLMTSYVMLAKHHGMTREQFLTAMTNVWNLNEAVEARGH